MIHCWHIIPIGDLLRNRITRKRVSRAGAMATLSSIGGGRGVG
jgi:hypothetical protein